LVDRDSGDPGGGGAREAARARERAQPRQRPVPGRLHRDGIVQAAVALADSGGLGEVSLRKVAAALAVGPMRLYGHVADKDELLDLMVDAVYGEIVPPEPLDGDWQSVLRALAHRVRQAALRHEWFVELLGGRPHTGPNALAHLETSLAALDAAPGFEHIDTSLRALETVNAYVIGAIRHEVAERRSERDTGLDEEQWQNAQGPYMERMLAGGRFPTLAKVVRDATHPGPDVTFDAGLHHVFAGIAAGVAAPPNGGRRAGSRGAFGAPGRFPR
jgi:AcrR family transcriptional regulator